MRIAYLCTDPGIPIHGTKGAAIHVRELARALAEAGHELAIWAARAGGPPPEGFTVPVHVPETRSPAAGRERRDRDLDALWQAAGFRRRLLPELARFGPDLVYERYSLFGAAGAGLAAALGLPRLLEVNAPLSLEQRRHRGLALVRTAEALEAQALRSADRVLAVSESVASWAVSRGVAERRVAVVPNGVDPRRFAGLPRPPAARARLGLPEAPTVGFVGSLKAWHGTADLLRAVARLHRAGRDLRLLVVGEGPEGPALAALAAAEGLGGTVTFAGAVPHAAVPAWLAAMDLAVAPYDREEGCYFSPLKLFEYLAAGRPVVAAAAGQIPGLLTPGRTGWLYPPGDVPALAHALATLLDDASLADRLGRAGQAQAAARHTRAPVAGRVLTLAEAAMDERPARAAGIPAGAVDSPRVA